VTSSPPLKTNRAGSLKNMLKAEETARRDAHRKQAVVQLDRI
jgi:hypothetical protein